MHTVNALGSELNLALRGDRPKLHIDNILREFGKPSFESMGMTEDVMGILKSDLFVNERRTNSFWELFCTALLKLNIPHNSDYTIYRDIFIKLLDEETFGKIKSEIVYNDPLILEHSTGKKMINSNIGIHKVANLYYLLQALHGAAFGLPDKQEKYRISSIKREAFRVFVGSFEAAKKIYSTSLSNIRLDRNAFLDKSFGDSKYGFRISCIRGYKDKTIMQPTYNIHVGSPDWAVGNKSILPGNEFHPKMLKKYVINNEKGFHDYLYE